MAATSQAGGHSANADGPAMLAAESELLVALNRLFHADSDAAWHDAVIARNTALRRLLIAVSDLPLDTRELVVTRATQAASRDLPAVTPDNNSQDDGARRAPPQ